jgi:oligo-1,6-glucosidase
LVKYKQIFSRYDSVFKDKGWLAIFLANHDQPRMVSKFGNDTPEFREVSSKMLSTFVLTMRGTAYYYNGDELGMDNIRFDSIQDYNDVDTKNKYLGLQKSGGDLKTFLQDKKQTSRDNGRTPFQWDATANAGFTTGTPWLKVNKNYTTLNAAAQDKDENSCLNYFRKLTKLRKENLALVYGKYTLLDKDNPDVFAYTRTTEGETFFILLNFTSKTVDFNFNEYKSINKLLVLNNYNNADNTAQPVVKLQPYQAIIYKAVK